MAKNRKATRGSRSVAEPSKSLEAEQRAISGEQFKNEGNDFFRQGKYTEAASRYNAAVDINGTQPVYMSNLAATYLKLEDYELAEKAAAMALIHDPRMTKARYRRGLARMGSNHLEAAKTDFETILREDPDCVEANVELAAVKQLFTMQGRSHADSASTDYEFPAPDHPPMEPLPLWLLSGELSSDSESESGPSVTNPVGHVGNGIPCKHHNHKGCAKGEDCAYSHAEDARSLQDALGKNVCLYFLMGSCKFGAERCVYSHSKANLPQLWDDNVQLPVKDIIYDNEQAIQEQRLFTNYMGKGPLASDTLLALKRATDEAKARKARSKPFILFLSLANEDFFERSRAHVLAAIRTKLSVSQALDAPTAMDLLSHPGLSGVFVTDAGIAERKHAQVLSKLVEFTRAGGSVVIGGMFSSFITPPKMAVFFRDAWGLPWKMGSYHRTTFSLNAAHETVKTNPSLALSYSMKAAYLRDIGPDAAVYVPTQDSHLQSMVWAPEQITNLSEAPVCQARIGLGRLGYIGDVNAEESSTNTILAMLGLLDGPLPLPQADFPPAPSQVSITTARFILHLSLDGSVSNGDTLSGLRDMLNVITVKTARKAISLLSSSALAGVFVTDAAIIHKKHANLLAKLAGYTKAGGIVVLGGAFSASINGMQAEAFFRKGWGLSWKLGSRQHTTFTLNSNHKLGSDRRPLPDSYIMEAVYLKGISADVALYLPAGHSHLDSVVFHSKQIKNLTEAPIVFAGLGKGSLGFIGDVNSEKETTSVTIAMFGLTSRPTS